MTVFYETSSISNPMTSHGIITRIRAYLDTGLQTMSFRQRGKLSVFERIEGSRARRSFNPSTMTSKGDERRHHSLEEDVGRHEVGPIAWTASRRLWREG